MVWVLIVSAYISISGFTSEQSCKDAAAVYERDTGVQCSCLQVK